VVVLNPWRTNCNRVIRLFGICARILTKIGRIAGQGGVADSS
jgi:hypothetical protein